MVELTANAQRVQKHREQKAADGYRRISVWVKEDDVLRVQKYVAKINKAAANAAT